MTKRDAISILKSVKWIADIDQSKKIATAIETIEAPMDEYKQRIRAVEEENRTLSGHILFVVSKAKEHGIEIEYDTKDLTLYYPSEWL